MAKYTLLIQCKDQPGLVANVSGALHRHGFNILSNREFVDHETNLFFMRAVFIGDGDEKKLVADIKKELPNDAAIRLKEDRRKKLLVMVTKEPDCLGDILMGCAYNKLNADVTAVIGNHNVLEELAKKFEAPFHHITHEGKGREVHEGEIIKIIDGYSPDFIVLAKYMRILTPGFVERYPAKIINIHHSFLPAFIGANPYKQAYERGVKLIGATAHYVNNNLDDGPIIAQGVIPVNHTHNAQDMASAGHDVEKAILYRAVRLVLEERVFLSGNKTIVFD